MLMQQPTSLFALFGGVRPMARDINEPVSNVYAWERANRIPAAKQRSVLNRGLALGLPVTPELVIFPAGDVPEHVTRAVSAVRAQHGPSAANAAPSAASDFHAIDRAGGNKYGNCEVALHTSARTVSA